MNIWFEWHSHFLFIYFNQKKDKWSLIFYLFACFPFGGYDSGGACSEYVSRKHKLLVHSKSITNENDCESSIQFDWRQCQSNENSFIFLFFSTIGLFFHHYSCICTKDLIWTIVNESKCLLILSTNSNKVAFMLWTTCAPHFKVVLKFSQLISNVGMPILLKKLIGNIQLYQEQRIDKNNNRIFKLNLIMYSKCCTRNGYARLTKDCTNCERRKWEFHFEWIMHNFRMKRIKFKT